MATAVDTHVPAIRVIAMIGQSKSADGGGVFDIKSILVVRWFGW
jgi:hypothetical protein